MLQPALALLLPVLLRDTKQRLATKAGIALSLLPTSVTVPNLIKPLRNCVSLPPLYLPLSPHKLYVSCSCWLTTSNLEIQTVTKYKNVKRLYFDGKSQIEQLNGQVEHLQNAVANQRMSQSRTALDDNEYVNRFNRLNGAINNLAFNIRKDWRRLPQWLENYVSPDALKTGKQEMTAVGRAVITKWIVDEVFNKCFHPDLDAALSAQLKEIELNIRGNAYTMHSQEEFDALTTKVVNWRMATLDGLQQKLSSSAAADNRASLITKTQTNLTANLYQFLIEPPPAGVDGSTSMIMELAVGIAANMPRESRDVTIQYPLPGDVLQAGVMDVEKTPLPPLDGQKEGESSKPDSDADKDKSSSSGDSSKTGRLHFLLPCIGAITPILGHFN